MASADFVQRNGLGAAFLILMGITTQWL